MTRKRGRSGWWESRIGTSYSRGRLRDVWSAIYERLRQESENPKFPKENRLHVRMLLLNPNSSEGLFRRHIEAASLKIPEDRVGLKPDVEAALTEL